MWMSINIGNIHIHGFQWKGCSGMCMYSRFGGGGGRGAADFLTFWLSGFLYAVNRGRERRNKSTLTMTTYHSNIDLVVCPESTMRFWLAHTVH